MKSPIAILLLTLNIIKNYFCLHSGKLCLLHPYGSAMAFPILFAASYSLLTLDPTRSSFPGLSKSISAANLWKGANGIFLSTTLTGRATKPRIQQVSCISHVRGAVPRRAEPKEKLALSSISCYRPSSKRRTPQNVMLLNKVLNTLISLPSTTLQLI